MTRLENFYSDVAATLDDTSDYSIAASIDNGDHEFHGVSRPDWLIANASTGSVVLTDSGEMGNITICYEADAPIVGKLKIVADGILDSSAAEYLEINTSSIDPIHGYAEACNVTLTDAEADHVLQYCRGCAE